MKAQSGQAKQPPTQPSKAQQKVTRVAVKTSPAKVLPKKAVAAKPALKPAAKVAAKPTVKPAVKTSAKPAARPAAKTERSSAKAPPGTDRPPSIKPNPGAKSATRPRSRHPVAPAEPAPNPKPVTKRKLTCK